MKIYFACYQSVGLIRGGPLVKIIQTKKYLEKLATNIAKTGVKAVHVVTSKSGSA